MLTFNSKNVYFLYLSKNQLIQLIIYTNTYVKKINQNHWLFFLVIINKIPKIICINKQNNNLGKLNYYI